MYFHRWITRISEHLFALTSEQICMWKFVFSQVNKRETSLRNQSTRAGSCERGWSLYRMAASVVSKRRKKPGQPRSAEKDSFLLFFLSAERLYIHVHLKKHRDWKQLTHTHTHTHTHTKKQQQKKKKKEKKARQPRSTQKDVFLFSAERLYMTSMSRNTETENKTYYKYTKLIIICKGYTLLNCFECLQQLAGYC